MQPNVMFYGFIKNIIKVSIQSKINIINDFFPQSWLIFNSSNFFIKDLIMSSIKMQLLRELSTPENVSTNKVTIVGVGAVGMACAFSILTQVNFYYFFNQSIMFFIFNCNNNFRTSRVRLLWLMFVKTN